MKPCLRARPCLCVTRVCSCHPCKARAHAQSKNITNVALHKKKQLLVHSNQAPACAWDCRGPRLRQWTDHGHDTMHHHPSMGSTLLRQHTNQAGAHATPTPSIRDRGRGTPREGVIKPKVMPAAACFRTRLLYAATRPPTASLARPANADCRATHTHNPRRQHTQ
jgi:hypothetical protein